MSELEINKFYAPIVHSHENASENKSGFMSKEDKQKLEQINTYSMRLSDTDGATFTTKKYNMRLGGENNKLFVSVKKNEEIVESGVVLFVANGVIYDRPIKHYDEYGSYFAILNIGWSDESHLGDHDIFAHYVGDIVGYTNDNKMIYNHYTYCMDYCIVNMIR